MTVLIQDLSNAVLTLTMNRPDVGNALDSSLIETLTQAFKTAPEAARVVILKGAGKHFSAGADVNWMKESIDFNKDQNEEEALKLAHLMQAIDTCPKPVIALTQGAVMGGGVGLVAAADVALADPSSYFCLSEVKLGLIPAIISPYVMRAIGERQARRYMLTAEKMGAMQAKNMGLIHEILDESFDLECLLEALAQGDLMAQGEAKKMIHHVVNSPLDEALIKHTARTIARLRVTPAAQDRLKAFLNKS